MRLSIVLVVTAVWLSSGTVYGASGCAVYSEYQNLKLQNVRPSMYLTDVIEAELCEDGLWTLPTGRILSLKFIAGSKIDNKVTFFDTDELRSFYSSHRTEKVDFKVGFSPPIEILVRTDGSFGEGVVFKKSGFVESTMFGKDTPLDQINGCEMILPSQADFVVEDSGELKIFNLVIKALCFPKPEGGVFKMTPVDHGGDVMVLIVSSKGYVTWFQDRNAKTTYDIPVLGKAIAFYDGHYQFHPNGIISHGQKLKKDESLMTEKSGTLVFKADSKLDFTTDGKVK